jgi:voltage-gated potassium channel
MRPLHSPLFRAFLLLLIILVVGVIGFYLIVPSYSFFDALYMTVITISNVGYGEVGELSNQRRVFAICLTLVGFVLVALAVRFIVESLLSNWTADFWKIKKTEK